jgi:putative IMPACT (imprinted ancient) family translation regulator
MRIMSVTVDYTWVGKIENELRSAEYQLKNTNYTENVEFEIYVEESRTESFVEWMTEMTNGQGKITNGDIEYLERIII